MRNQFRYGLTTLIFGMLSCSGQARQDHATIDSTASVGIGEVKEVILQATIENDKAERGFKLFEERCSSCHKLTNKRLIGPGWKDVTKRRKPEWIMNMITNVNVMLDKDPEAQKLFEQCLVRMPRQNITMAQARDILEFMRSNDFQAQP